MTKKNLFVDFDRTLIDTDRLIEASWRLIGEKYHIAVEQTLTTLDAHYNHVGDLRYYYFDGHIEEVVKRPADEVAAAIYPELQKQDFVYPDAGGVLTWQKKYDVRILTFGADWYQHFKLGLAPQFKNVPTDIILRPKGEFIAEQFGGRSGWLVDDKYNGSMPPGFTEIHLVRSSSLTISNKGGIITVNSLKALKELL